MLKESKLSQDGETFMALLTDKLQKGDQNTFSLSY